MPKVDRQVIYERDQGLCGFCGQSVPIGLVVLVLVILALTGGTDGPMMRERLGDLLCRTVHRWLGAWAEDYVMSTPTYGSWPRGTQRCCWCLRLWLPGESSSQITEEGVR